MPSQNKWSKNELISLYQQKKDGKSNKDIATFLNKSEASIERKHKRVDWDDFLEDPDGYMVGNVKKWNLAEMNQLYAFLESKKSYAFIAEKLNRSIISIERKAQRTDWRAWAAALGTLEIINKSPEPDVQNEKLIDQLVDALVVLSRHDPVRLSTITDDDFSRKINFDQEHFPVNFSDIRKKASERLDAMGLGNPENISLKKGVYIVVGDSHGKFTKSKLFHMLKHVENHLKPNSIIHIGHILDDDNDISFEWGNFKNLTILAKREELQLVQQQRNKFNFSYNIVRGSITIGDELIVMNQDLIDDYVKTPISAIDQEIFDEKVITNCHRVEFTSKCSDGDPSYYASPGCLCERHIVKTIKQIDFEDDRIVKTSYHDGFKKYRRMEHMNKFWKQGMLVVNVDEHGDHTIVPCFIKKIGGQYVTSYFDKIITSNGVEEPDEKIFVHGDMHSPNHDINILDIQEEICVDYTPNIFVNLGDAHDFRSLNHHEMERGRVIFSDVLEESAKAHHILKRMAKWAPEYHIIFGNHERFSEDFVAKYPQFRSYLDFRFICGLDDLGYKLTNLKSVLRVGQTKFIHGEMKMFGQPGSKLEKASRTFGDNVFIGHVHYVGIRFGSLTPGCACLLDQGYNEPNASTWIHGFGMANHYMGHSFPTVVAITKNKCIIGNKVYEPKTPKRWVAKKIKAKICYETE